MSLCESDISACCSPSKRQRTSPKLELPVRLWLYACLWLDVSHLSQLACVNSHLSEQVWNEEVWRALCLIHTRERGQRDVSEPVLPFAGSWLRTVFRVCGCKEENEQVWNWHNAHPSRVASRIRLRQLIDQTYSRPTTIDSVPLESLSAATFRRCYDRSDAKRRPVLLRHGE